METPSETSVPNRWLIAIMGTALQLCLGTVYAWSVFQKPVMAHFGAGKTAVVLAFSLTIFCLGLASAWGGINLPRHGPRKLAVIGGVLFGLGYLVAALALKLLWMPLFYLGYGVIGGAGLGLGYVTPVATAAKWFPDKKGLVTGMVIMGFGFGALLMSTVFAPLLMKAAHNNLVTVFVGLGVLLGGASMIVGAFLRNPPAGFQPPTRASVARAPSDKGSSAEAAQDSLTPRGCLFSRRFALMWLFFFCNITAGIAIISFQSPLMQELWRRIDPALPSATLTRYGAILVAISSLFNGIGRMWWGGLSDRIGRAATFRLMMASEILAFGVLMLTGNPWLFGAMICYVLLCYGGGFGTMPSFVLDVFGQRMMATVYGVILTAWSSAGLVGPLLFGLIGDRYKDAPARAAVTSFVVAAGFLTIGLIASLAVGNERFEGKPSA